MAARKKYDEDLFAGSTMTFGEHLEELRACLFKSIVALVLGSAIGLLPFIGGNVVKLIKSPLERALAKYRESHAADKARELIASDSLGGDMAQTEAARVGRFLEENHLLVEEVLINPDWVAQELRRRDPQRFGTLGSGGPAGAPKDAQGAAKDGAAESIVPRQKEDLFPLLLFRPTEEDPRVHPKALGTQEAFVIYLKASLLVGVLLASPYIFYQIWSFVAAGLYPHEKHYVHVFLPFSLALFLAGASLAFFFVFEPVLSFLFSFNRSLGIEAEPRITEWLSFVLFMPLGFGISFQLPLVMLFLERIRVLDVKAYLSKWRVAVLVIFFLAMVLTPSPDPYSMLLMAFPLTALYFGGILLCKYLPRRGGWSEEE